MITKENLEKIKNAVHQPLNWEDYNSTAVIEDTNCFSHAIGSTIMANREAYRLGMLSGKKKIKDGYFSKEEVKTLFQADLSVVQLENEEIPFENLTSFLEYLTNTDLADNEHIVALFVKIYGNEYIRDFHFLRYDKEKGWSEKRWGRNVHWLENVSREWPSDWNDRLVGIFKITR